MKNKKLFIAGLVAVIALATAAAVAAVIGIIGINGNIGEYELCGEYLFTRDPTSEEEYSEDNSVAVAVYTFEEYVLEVKMPYEDYEGLPYNDKKTGYVYLTESGRTAVFEKETDESGVKAAIKEQLADENKHLFGIAMALFLVAAGIAVVTFFSGFFSVYEKIWFVTILIAASVVSILFPEEDTNGINGIWIMALYLADTFLNILCELLISKQSKWNFIVSVFVEVTEIVMCILLAYRFATLATTLFFWLPVDIISFINWHKHPDEKSDEVTVVRKLSGWGSTLVIAGIVIWTAVVGYFLSGIDIATDLFGGNQTLENIVCYLDASASAVGIANGLFILFRYREQWIAWYICSALESVINILSGQFVLLVLKLGFFTNTTYGYIKWTKYISSRRKDC